MLNPLLLPSLARNLGGSSSRSKRTHSAPRADSRPDVAWFNIRPLARPTPPVRPGG